MARLSGHQHVYDLCRALSVDARSHCLSAHYFHHFWVHENFHLWMVFFVVPTTTFVFMGCRQGTSSLRDKAVAIFLHEHLGVVLHRRGRNLPIFLCWSQPNYTGRLRELAPFVILQQGSGAVRVLKACCLPLFSTVHTRFFSRLRPFSQLQALPKSKLRRLLNDSILFFRNAERISYHSKDSVR